MKHKIIYVIFMCLLSTAFIGCNQAEQFDDDPDEINEIQADANDCQDCPVDNDGDGYEVGGNAAPDIVQDCDDNDPDIYPGAPEIANGLDDDCNGIVDDLDGDDELCLDCPDDKDGDGYVVGGNAAPGFEYDCDDNDPNIYPGAPEIANGLDDDCNGIIDDLDGDEDLCLDCPEDKDGDGFIVGGNAAPGFPTDCDDNDATIYPGAPDPFGDGIDQSCSGADGI